MNLYFRGKKYPARRLANKVVEVVTAFGTGSRMQMVQLIEEDLQALALMKYSGCIVRNHPDTLSPRVRSFLEAISAEISEMRLPETAHTVDILDYGRYGVAVLRGSENAKSHVEILAAQYGRRCDPDTARSLYKRSLERYGEEHTQTQAMRQFVDANPKRTPHVRMVRAAALQPGMVFRLNDKVWLRVEKIEAVAYSCRLWVSATDLRGNCIGVSYPIFLGADYIVASFVEWRDKVAL